MLLQVLLSSFRRAVRPAAAGLLALLLGLAPAAAQLPAGFFEQVYASGFQNAIGLTFDPLGRMYVSEKNGRVWVVENGLRAANPLIDIQAEVGGWRDFGLLGFVLDPNYLSNGHVYLLYTVDRHHLMNFGTGAYSAATNDYFSATIGRITRYTVNNPTAAIDAMTLNYASRLVLLGETPQTGVPSLHESHGIGSLAFGTDGTLLVTCGDGASYNNVDQGSDGGTYYAQALASGIITSAENIGAWRCQAPFSLNGKILRLDPATGNGVPSNPNYDPLNPRSPQSRTWGRGLRNPCRASLRPGTGSHNPADANPGSLYIGDVGWGSREELNVCNGPSQNFGWPRYEGMTIITGYSNPTYNTFTHTLAKIDWRGGAARGFIGGNIYNVGTPQFPGVNFGGNCAIGGTWYTGTDFPAEYQNTYFFADYGAQWIRNAVMDANDNPVEVRTFQPAAGSITAIGSSPTSGGIYYVNNGGNVMRISYNAGNLPPHAVAAASDLYGPGPLTVYFQGSNSTDPENQALTYFWDFGNGNTSTDPNPSFTFSGGPGPVSFPVTLTVTDNQGATDQASLVISLNNTPPVITSTSLDGVIAYPMAAASNYPLSAVVTDAEHSPAQLSYGWQTFLYHDNHNHPESVDPNPVSNLTLSPVGCDGILYYYEEVLTVTDAGGLSSSVARQVYPDCGGPIAVNDNAAYLFGQATVVDILANDDDNGGTIAPGSVTIVRQPFYGTLVVNANGSVTYTHNGTSTLPDNFLYKVENTGGDESGVAIANLRRGGAPAIIVSTPMENDVIFSTSATVSFSAQGDLAGNERVRLTLDGGTPVLQYFSNGSYTFTGLPYGPHVLLAELLDNSNTPLGNPEASITVNFTTALRPEPGGVGSSLTLWYKADAGVQLNGSNVALWEDQGLGGFDVGQAIATQQPLFKANALNFNPALDFDGGDRLWLANVLSDNIFSADEATVIVAQRAAGVVSFSYGDFADNSKVVIEQCGDRFDFANIVTDGPGPGSCNLPVIAVGRADVPQRQMIVNGVQVAATTNAALQNLGDLSEIEIGAHKNAFFVDGDVAEVIVFDKALTEPQLDSLLTYLSVKYGINIDVASHLYYDYTGHPNNLAGIGRNALEQDLVQPKSRNSHAGSVITVENPASLDDGDYLVWGNDGGALNTLLTTGLPSGVSGRIARTWRVQETNEVGTVDISFDLSVIGIPVASASDVKLLIDDDGNFANATVLPASSLIGNSARFNGVDFSSGQWVGLAVEVACLPWCDAFNPVGNSSAGAYGCYTITPALANQAGAVWFDSAVDLSEAFRFEFDLNLGSNDANGADGVTFSFQKTGLAALGGFGGGLGITGIAPSLSVEFDTWENGGEIAGGHDHMRMFYGGVLANALTASVCMSPTCANTEDGLVHRVVVDWNPVTDKFQVFFDGVLRIDYTGDIVAQMGGNPWAYFGMTGGTGGSVNLQTFCVVDLQGKFADPADACFNCTPGGYIINGTAAANGPQCIRLTNAVNTQVGTAWFDERANLNYDFNIEYDLYAGASDAGADGTTFVFQRSAAGKTAVGNAGGEFGAGGLTPSVGIEFDTYFNAGAVPFGDAPGSLTGDHITIFQNGNLNSFLSAPTQVCALASCGNIEDGVFRRVIVDWDASTTTLRVFYNGVLRATYVGDIVNTIFGGDPLVYFGFTGATGGLNNVQECCVISQTAVYENTPFPVELLDFRAEAVEGRVNLSWATLSELNNDFFTVQRSRDGLSYETVATVKGAGTSNEEQSYASVDEKPYGGRSFYRLMQTDFDGTVSLSPRVEVYLDPAQLPMALELYPNPVKEQAELNLDITLREAAPARLEVFNVQGRRVLSQELEGVAGTQTLQVPTRQWAAGVYHVRLSAAGQSASASVVIE
jgi:glucose/arabinose dehydrogenase